MQLEKKLSDFKCELLLKNDQYNINKIISIEENEIKSGKFGFYTNNLDNLLIDNIKSNCMECKNIKYDNISNIINIKRKSPIFKENFDKFINNRWTQYDYSERKD